MRGRWLLVLAIVTAAALWLMYTPRYPEPLNPLITPQPVSPELARSFEANRCGALACRATWTGARPVVKPLSLLQAKARPGGRLELPNPNAPIVGDNGGLANAIVFLRGVDLSRSRPWDHPPARVELTETEFQIIQGSRRGPVGIVRRGADVEFVARSAVQHSARARGAAFFTQMLFVPDSPVRRPLSDAGIVELSSGSGCFWMRGYLAVSDHPYVGVTDTDGNVRFEQVPDGHYELVCWHANWNIAALERDPEWILQSGLTFRPGLEKVQPVRVVAGQLTSVNFAFALPDFAP